MRQYLMNNPADAVVIVLLLLIVAFALGAWLAGLYDLRHPLPAPALREVPDQAPIAAQHCAKVYARRDAADLARGTSENLRGFL